MAALLLEDGFDGIESLDITRVRVALLLDLDGIENAVHFEDNVYLAFVLIADAMAEARGAWVREYEAMLKEREIAGDGPAAKAMGYRIERMEREYLLKELCQRGFLPAHGFPMHIATFDTLHAEQMDALRNAKEMVGAETDFSRGTDLPSRSLPIALTEYAPGNSVAINGLIFESAGITLNWHKPATAEAVREIQNLRSRWHCSSCHASGTLPTRQLSSCPSCGRSFSSSNWWEYLEPAGFAVDFSKEPSNYGKPGGRSIRAYTSVNMEGEWMELGLSGMVRFRCTPSGRIFTYSDGLHHKGYAVCLSCGRVESMEEDGKVPASMQVHDRLRSCRGSRSAKCSASRENWQVRRALRLGCEVNTDVLELQIRKEDRSWLNDEVQALPIAIALRDALAARLGIQAEELGCSVERRRSVDAREPCVSIYIYDRNSAGYSSSAARFLKDLLAEARRRLLCEKGQCQTACPLCILNFDLRYQSRDLDRNRGLDVLTQQWMEMLGLAEEDKVFGESSSVESLPLLQSVLEHSLHAPSSRVILHIGYGKLWQADSPDLMRLLHILASRDTPPPILLALDKEFLEKISRSERILLAAKLGSGITCAVLEGGFQSEKALLAVTVEQGGQLRRWAVCDRNGVSLCLCGITHGDLGSLREVSPEELMPVGGSDAILRVSSTESFTVASFGGAMWKLIRSCLKTKIGTDPIGELLPIRSIEFSDRYCGQPLATALLFRMLSSLKTSYGSSWGCPVVALASVDWLQQGDGSMSGNWGSAEQRDEVWHALFSHLGKELVSRRPKNLLPHYRFMKLTFENGSFLNISLDQGFGFVRLHKASWDGQYFDFGASPDEQAYALAHYDAKLSVVPGGTLITMELASKS